MSAPEELSELVFVYGGLRRSGAEAFHMIGAEYLRMGEVAGTLLEISGTPALIPRRGHEKGWATGELFQVTPEHLLSLDAIAESSHENGSSSYQRVRMKVYLPGSPILQGDAWVWQWSDPASTGNIVRSGDWMDVSHPRPFPWCTLAAGLCLVGFFGSFAGTDSRFPALGAVQYRHVIFLCISMVPMVACVTAWWGLRRREKCELLTMLVMVAAAVISLPFGLAIAVEIISRFIGLF